MNILKQKTAFCKPKGVGLQLLLQTRAVLVGPISSL